MRLLAVLFVCLLGLAGAAAGLVHDHHHLIIDADGGDREEQLEASYARGKLSRHAGGPEGCESSTNAMAEAILQGQHKSYAFGGVPEHCGEGYGCKDDYWGKWCRFKHRHAPICPYEVQQDLQSRLMQAANDGHSWARDILLVRPCEIFPYIEGRTLWILGDSMSKDFAFSFQCFMLEYWDHKDSGRWPANPSMSPNVSDDPDLMRDVIAELGKIEPNKESDPWYLQWCIPMYGNTRMCFMRFNVGSFYTENIMPLMPRLATRDDIVLLNFGLHSNDNGTLYNYIQELKEFGYKYQEEKDSMPQYIWRQTSVQHFAMPMGEWVPDKPQQEQQCVPIKGLQLGSDGWLNPEEEAELASTFAADMTNAMDTMLRGGRRNVRADYVMGKLGIPVMHIWNQTLPFWEYHRYYHDPEDGTACAKVDCDCTHICVPSWHQMWMASLQKTLAQVGYKGSPRCEEWGLPATHPIPGINVPLKYFPHVHNVTVDSISGKLMR